jgi:hypothetical protein
MPLFFNQLEGNSEKMQARCAERTVEGRQLPRLFAETRGFSSLPVSNGLGLRLFLD